jgi:hypothetical protein
MLETFMQHRSDFNRLQQMVSEDPGLYRVTKRVVKMLGSNAPLLPSHRIAEYRSLLKKIGASELSTRLDRVSVVYSSGGLSIRSWSKGWYSRSGRLLEGLTVLFRHLAKCLRDASRASIDQ